MNIWMTHFLSLLTTDNALLKTDDDEEPGVLEELKSQICDNIGLYAHKYEEEFSPYMNQFVTAVWNLLLSSGLQVKYDGLVSNAIQFMASVADRQQYKSLFEDKNILGSICEKIIVPNMEMRDVDVELFEDNPEEYIRRDLEGSDLETRRRAACDLVKGLSRYFESQITEIFGSYVKTMLDMYQTNPAQNWKSKDAAIYLVTSLATRAKTAKHGITQINQLVNLTEFCTNYILPDLQNSDANGFPVLKADAIKYMLTFKSQLPPEMMKQCLPVMVNFLKANSHVVHTYAATTIEKILILKTPENKALVTSSELGPIAEPLLTGLFGAFSLPGSAENEYVMKCVMRSFSALQESVVPFLASLLPVLTQKLQQAAKNPTRPHYNHYLFESLSLSIRIHTWTLYGIISLFTHACLWERPANITPLVRLIQAYVSRGPQQIVEANKVEGLLGVFQKLIASKSTDHEGFYLVQSMVEHLPPAVIGTYIKPIFTLLFQRLTSSKTTKFVKSFLVFMFLFVIKYDGMKLQETIDSIQSNMFSMVCQRLIVLEIQKISGLTEKKIAAIGITKLLTETPCLLSGAYASNWPTILNALIGLFELPQDESIPDDEHFIEVEDTPGYQTAYSQLVFAGKRKVDPVASITDPKIHLAQSLQKLSASSPGVISPLIGQLEPQAQQFLQSYLQGAGVNLS
ncbi:CSE1 [Lepeophtheirus salmonis]|uniref:CSE1 n=1 Tax=Lepeophtheirus salmonis TaxID=72036 RepID=A0A7R8CRB1_LEPSM|nr:CSE1 [Lepeophtheirus salmonis]CAF2903518.1 CSE1 [Lepeophtheirus salmonis]